MMPTIMLRDRAIAPCEKAGTRRDAGQTPDFGKRLPASGLFS
jgi:hypothetical protein